jgi:hypothetical protein
MKKYRKAIGFYIFRKIERIYIKYIFDHKVKEL